MLKIAYFNYNVYSGFSLYKTPEECTGVEEEFTVENNYHPKPTKFQADMNPLSGAEEAKLRDIGKKKELELIASEIEKISNEYEICVEKKSHDKLMELNKKKKFLIFKFGVLEKISPKFWEYFVKKILGETDDKIVKSKEFYSNKDITFIAKILAKVFKNDEILSHIVDKKIVEKYIPISNIRISWEFDEIFGSKTYDLLLKSLSYFVFNRKVDFINVILQAIDIFANKKNDKNLYKEIWKIGDPDRYDAKFNKQENFGKLGNPKNYFVELRDKLEKKMEEKTKTNNIFPPRYVAYSVSDKAIDIIYDNLEKANNAMINKKSFDIDKKIYLWRYTKLVDEKEMVYWMIKDDGKPPNDAHSKYSEYFELCQFVKYIVNDTDFFAKKNALLNSVSLCELTQSKPAPPINRGCWDGTNQKIKDAINLPVKKEEKVKVKETMIPTRPKIYSPNVFDEDIFDSYCNYNYNDNHDDNHYDDIEHDDSNYDYNNDSENSDNDY
jgi:hypothetical protein